MISVEQAQDLVLALAGDVVAEEIALDQADGRVLAAPAISRMTQPPFNSAAMDGYALRGAEIDQPLRVIGEAAAGHPWTGQPAPGTAIRIFTGAPVPDGYDRVVMQENTRRDGDILHVTDSTGGDHIRPRGSDFALGDQVPAGLRLTPADLGLLAAMNLPRVQVARRPRVAIMASGDELVRPGETPAAGQIICSNDLAIAALARRAGADVTLLPIARDTESSLRECLSMASDVDLLVTIGGASVGDHDLVGKVATEMGLERAFYKIRMRPGKPLMAGKLGRSAMLGLPGNPVSSIVCAILFMQPFIRRMQGLPGLIPLRKARLDSALPPEGDRQHYLRSQLKWGGDLPVIIPFSSQDSARLALMSQADALLVRPPHDPARDAGDLVDYLPLGVD